MFRSVELVRVLEEQRDELVPIAQERRVRWVSGSPGKPPAYAGTDFMIVRDGKIAAVYLFFDELP
jgi:hypothetical protein